MSEQRSGYEKDRVVRGICNRKQQGVSPVCFRHSRSGDKEGSVDGGGTTSMSVGGAESSLALPIVSAK